MTSLTPLRRVCVLLLLSATAVLSTRAQPTDFHQQLESVHLTGDSDALSTLIQQNRLHVKPVVNTLIKESLKAELAGDQSNAKQKHMTAAAVASAFEAQFGEKSLSEAVSYLNKWTLDEKRTKLRADSLYDAATEQRGSGETRLEALENYTEAITAYREIGDRIGAATTLGGIGFVYWYLGDTDSTVAYINAGLEARRAVDDRELLGNSLNDMGSVSRLFVRDNKAAEEYYREAAEVREEIGDNEGLAKTLTFLGDLLQSTGNLRESVDHFDRATQLALEVGDTARAATALLEAGVGLGELDEHTEALNRMERSLELRAPDDPDMPLVLTQIGNIYQRLGDYDAAFSKHQEVIRIAEDASDSTLLAIGFSNAGVVLQWAERFEQAARYFERALDIYERLGDDGGKLHPLINLASVHQDLKQYDQSEPYARKALPLSRELEDPVREAMALILLGNLYNLTGRDDGGLSYYEEGLQLARELKMPELEWAALLGFGERLERMGEYEEAVEFYLQGLDNAERVRSGLLFGDDKAKFLAQKRFAYEAVVHLLGLLHEQHPDEDFHRRAFEIAERGKARAFLDLLSEAVAKEESKLDPEVIQKQETLLEQMGENQRSMQLAMASPDPDSDSLDALRGEREDLEEDYQTLQREIRLASPAYARMSDAKPADLAEIQQHLLDSGTVLLQYAVGDSSSSLWAVSEDAVQMYQLPPRRKLQDQVEVLRFALSNPDPTSVETFATPARRLYRELVMPAEELISEADEIIIVPDDVLHYVPFDVLLTDDRRDGSFADLPYLVRSYSTSYGHSVSVLLQLKTDRGESQREHERTLLAIGDPDFGDLEAAQALPSPMADLRAGLSRLPYSGAEVQTIAETFAGQSADVFVREEAREEKLKEEGVLEQYQYIHLATHGIVDERRPDFSGIVLAQDSHSGEDGYLQAAEIFNLKIGADLVVLSACETGLGEMVRGEGLVGLTRAFMYAGAPSIVVSLWKVSDASTSELMKQFYEAMVEEGSSKAAALQDAKLALLEDDSHAHPFHWAPFVLTGNRN